MKRSCLYSTLGKKWRRCGSSTELMVAFHKNLTDPEGAVISKAEALRQAELQLLATKRFRQPFYWASFAVIGDGL